MIYSSMFTHEREVRLINGYLEMCGPVCDWLIFSSKGLSLVE